MSRILFTVIARRVWGFRDTLINHNTADKNLSPRLLLRFSHDQWFVCKLATQIISDDKHVNWKIPMSLCLVELFRCGQNYYDTYHNVD